MGLRYRKTVRIVPGVRLNISKSGISTSIGKPGATINLSKRGTKATVGIPGSGVSYSRMVSQKATKRRVISKQEADYRRAELREKYGFKNSEIKRMVKYAKRHPQRFRAMSEEQIIARFQRRMSPRTKKVLLVILLIILIIAFLNTFTKQ